jgi:nitrate reductase delta subunit
VIGSRRKEGLTIQDRVVALQACSLLLAYPEPALLEQLPLLLAAVADLEDEVGRPLTSFCEHLQATPLHQLQLDYVDTFDLRRRCCLYLTYFSHGDTRKRGMALLRFSHAYGSSGMEFTGGDLPDHLPVVCEFAATGDAVLGLRLLAESRAGLELIRAALGEARSPYLGLLDAVCATLPPATRHDLDKARLLAVTGPPEEEVGLEPYGPPELMGGRR